MEKAGGMKLNELHVGNDRARPPGHGHAVAGRHVGVGGIKVNFAASSGSQHHGVAAQRLDQTRGLVENVNPDTTILHSVAEFPGGEKIDRHVILQHRDGRMVGNALDQRALDLETGGVLKMQHPPLGVSALLAQIEFPLAVCAVPLIKLHAEFHQAGNAFGSLGDDSADGLFIAQSRPGHQSVPDMKIEGIFLADHASHSALSPGRVGIHRAALCHQGHGTLLSRFERIGKSGDSAADNDKIEFSHERVDTAILSINRVAPRKTATASRIGRTRFFAGSRVSASTSSR